MQFCIFIGILKYHNSSCYRFMMIESEHKTADKKKSVFAVFCYSSLLAAPFCADDFFCVNTSQAKQRLTEEFHVPAD